MQIDIVSSEVWESLGDELRTSFQNILFQDPLSENLAPPSPLQLRAYRGAGHAAFEAAYGLVQVFAHKRSLAVIKGFSPVFDFLVAQYLKEAFQVQATDHGAITSAAEWCEQFKKDTNFVLLAEDHPVTGAIFNTEEIDQILNSKKIFSLRVSHARHLQGAEEVRPFSARILSFGADLAVTVYGSKFRAQGLIAPQMGWEKSGTIQKIQRKRKRIFDQNLVQTFENQFPDWQYFQVGSKRIYDRAVLVFPGATGEAIISELAEAMSLNRNLIADLMSTTHACAWEDPLVVKSWWSPAPTAEQLRGLVVFSAELLARKDFAKLVKTAYDKIIGLQESFL